MDDKKMNGYQNVVLNGVQRGKIKKREHSKFFNEGKWENFIKPFLPNHCPEMVFMDIGCNNGLYLRLAKQHEFDRIIGIDSNPDVCSIAREYSGEEVIVGEINEEIYRSSLLTNLPASDYILLANTHYHIYAPAFVYFLNIIRKKCRYVIVVSAEDARAKLYRASHKKEWVRKFFKDWEEVGHIHNIDGSGDPAPRDMFSLLFKSDIERLPIKDLSVGGRFGRNFYRKVLRGTKEQGVRTPQTHPILLRPGMSVYDGRHRLASLEADGYSTVLCEKL